MLEANSTEENRMQHTAAVAGGWASHNTHTKNDV